MVVSAESALEQWWRPCGRSEDGQHVIVRSDLTEYCAVCFVVPRLVSDTIGDLVTRPRQETPPPKPKRTDLQAPPKARRADWSCAPSTRNRIYQRDGMRCRYCGAEVHRNNPDLNGHRRATLDHVLPRSRGGRGVENLVTACWLCNHRKGDRTPDEAGMTVLPVPPSMT